MAKPFLAPSATFPPCSPRLDGEMEENTVAMTEIQSVTRVTTDSLRAFGIEAFEQAGLPEEGATIITEVQLESALRGQPTHNMGDVPNYCRRIKAGQMNPRPNVKAIKQTSVSGRIDGDNGPGQW